MKSKHWLFILLIAAVAVYIPLYKKGLRSSPYEIMGTDKIQYEFFEKYLLSHNPAVSPKYVRELIRVYDEECRIEGVRFKVAFAQMCHETDYLKFSGQVAPHQNNFAGVGAVSDYDNGYEFKTMREGVRVQVQHLKSYASKKKLRRECIDMRRAIVEELGLLGSATTVFDLAGTWAADPLYGEKIARIIDLF